MIIWTVRSRLDPLRQIFVFFIRSSVYFGCGISIKNTKSYKHGKFFYFFVHILVNATTSYISEIQKFPVKRL